ncbi:hypothetical protein [Rhizobium sp. BR 314]|uniref:hypothetical protein n=1 Tax=Rhizobium sp. BR 314 TaxID=3040013 RepID=UPI0039BEF2D8
MTTFASILPTVLSVLSLCLSVFTLWMTQLRRGKLKMTQPTLVCLKREQPSGRYKLFVRTLLYATAIKGCGVELMFAQVTTNYGSYLFDFWGHTESGKLTLGSGLFVGQTGVTADHHFNPRRDAMEFLFVDGPYHIELFARIVGIKKPIKLQEVEFTLDGLQAGSLIQILDTELFLYWNPETGGYESELRRGDRTFHTRPPDFPSWFNLNGGEAEKAEL